MRDWGVIESRDARNFDVFFDVVFDSEFST